MKGNFTKAMAVLILITVLVIFVPISALAYETSATVSDFLSAANDVVGVEYIDNSCLQFVSDFFASGRTGYDIPGMGFQGAYNLGSAIIYWDSLQSQGRTNSSMDNIPIGADVFFNNGAYGHVGIYIGNGQFINAGDKVYVNSFWNDPSTGDFYGNHYIGWAWHDYVSITSYTLKETKIMENAQEILDQYANMNEYINWLASQQHYYRTTLNEAECYNNAYTTIMSYSTALADVGVHVLTGDALSAIRQTAENAVKGELNCYFPEMTTEEFIYSQAKMGVESIERTKLFEIQDELEDGKFVNPESAAEFIRIYQKNKAALAAAEMGRQYYYEELNKNPLDHFFSLFTSVATCQVSGLFQDVLTDSEMNELADGLLNMLGIVSDCYDNEYVDAWISNLRQIEDETEVLFARDVIKAPNAGTVEEPVPTVLISFDANGGSVGLVSRQYVQNEALGYLPTPFRFGYDFLGWYDDSGSQYTTSSAANANLILYAHWSRIILDSGSCGDHLTYVLYGDGVLEITGSGEMTSAPWSSYAGRVGEVVLPEGLTCISYSAFYGCKCLQEIHLPSTVTWIGDWAFGSTGLQSLTLSDGVAYLGRSILGENTGVKELTVPGSVTTFYWNYETGTFCGSALETVVFEEGITSLGAYAFNGVTTLMQVELPNTLTAISDSAFYGCENLSMILLPDSLKSIGNSAFAQTGLTELVLPSGVSELGSYMLYGNDQIRELTIPNTYTTGASITYGSAVEKVIFEEGIQSIPCESLSGAESLKEVVLPSTLIKIEDRAFSSTGLQGLTLPEGVEWLGCRILAGNTGVKELTVPGSVRVFYWYSSTGTFSGSALERVIFEEGITSLGAYAFNGVTTLTQVELPNTLTAISDSAFYGCENLKTILLPDSLKSIGNSAFAQTGLTELVLPSGVSELGSYFLYGNEQIKELTIPNTYMTGASITYGSAVEKVIFEEGLKSIPCESLSGAESLKEVVLPSTLIKIEDRAFSSTGLQGLTLPEGVEWLGCRILAGNTGVKELTVPGSVRVFDWYSSTGTFSGSALESVVFEEGITSLGRYVFNGVTTLMQVELPDTLTAISSYAFYGCNNLTDIYYHGTIEAWNSINIGNGNDQLQNVIIHCIPVPDFILPVALTVIEDEAFAECGFTCVRLSENTQSIGNLAFYRCLNLKSIYIPEKTENIASNAFEAVPVGLVIYGVPGSYAESYAEAVSITFVPIK